MTKKPAVERGIWRRETKTEPEIDFAALLDAIESGAKDGEKQIIEKYRHELRQVNPSALEDPRETLKKLRDYAAAKLGEQGYPAVPGWYRFDDAAKEWVPSEGEGVAWPYFDDIEPLSRADIAKNVIVAVDQVIGLLTIANGLARAMLSLMGSFHTFATEFSRLGSHAAVPLKLAEDGATGGKASRNTFGGPDRVSACQARADLIWKEEPRLTKLQVAKRIKKQLDNDPDYAPGRKFHAPTAGTIYKWIRNPSKKRRREAS